MLGACIDLELGQLRGGELVPRKHALDRLADNLGRPSLELLAQGSCLQAAGEAGMPVDQLLVELLPGDVDLLRVDDDHEVARVDVRRVAGLASCRARSRRSVSQAGPGSSPRRRRRTSRAESLPAWRYRSSCPERKARRAHQRGSVAGTQRLSARRNDRRDGRSAPVGSRRGRLHPRRITCPGRHIAVPRRPHARRSIPARNVAAPPRPG